MNTLEYKECIFINDSHKCTLLSYKCYGGFCKKHKHEYLLQDGFISNDRFTGNSKDYKLCDLKKYCNTKLSKSPSTFKKADYFKKFTEYHTRYIVLTKNMLSITKIQSHIRRYLIYNKLQSRGIAYLNRKLCNNDEDFYTYDPIQEIEDTYFFSYKDKQNNYWGFDIRSLKKLIDMNYGNPYTTEQIPDIIKNKVYTLIKDLHNDNVTTLIDTSIISDRKTLVKQKFVDIFAQIEYMGYSCDVKWVLDLYPIHLKRLYRELEDIWNYRANLSSHIKCSIVPPDGRLCIMPVADYNRCINKVELLEILGNEVYKICSATDSGNMQLGFMYFIIALSYVSRPCSIIHTWVQSIF